jgi:hypothetical protein
MSLSGARLGVEGANRERSIPLRVPYVDVAATEMQKVGPRVAIVIAGLPVATMEIIVRPRAEVTHVE